MSYQNTDGNVGVECSIVSVDTVSVKHSTIAGVEAKQRQVKIGETSC
jgi:hypothetical protein